MKKLRSWSPEHFGFIDGLRTLALMWTILGVVYIESRVVPADNAETAIPAFLENIWFVGFVGGATFARDIFIFFAGFLASYQSLSLAARAGHFPGLLALYVDKVFRMVPFVALGVFLFAIGTPYAGTGPFWDTAGTFARECQHHWWEDVLFIRNLMGESKLGACGWWLFPLQMELQLFIITPFLLLLFYRSRGIGLSVILALMAVSYGLTAWFATSNKLGISPVLDEKLYSDVWVQPYTSFDIYGIGLLLGIFFTSDFLPHAEDRFGFSMLQSVVQSPCLRYTSYLWGVLFTLPLAFLPYDYFRNYA